MSDAPVAPTQLTAYLRKLLLFLCLVAFFDGYDLFAISQTLPELRAAFGLPPAAGSRLLALANLGTVAAYLLIRLADRWGRRPLLVICLAGYSGAALGSAVAPEQWSFLLGQLAVRFFLVSALAMAVLYATEEYPAERRGRIVGLIQASYSFGGIVCAAVTPRLLQTSLSWRAVYFLGASSAGLLLFACRSLRETERFRRLLAAREPAAGTVPPPPLWPRLPQPPYRRRMFQLAVIWVATFLCNQSATVFWKEYAQAERGLSAQRIGAWVATAAVVALPLTVLSGRLIDRIGRRRGAAIVYLSTAGGVLGSYAQLSEGLLLGSLILLIAGATATVALLSAWTAESFPTDLRGDSFAWANSLIGRLGFVLSPLFVAQLVPTLGWGRTLSLTAGFPLLALGLTWLWLQETARKELEESPRLAK